MQINAFSIYVEADVAANGAVVYTDSAYDLIQFLNNTYTVIQKGFFGATGYSNPVTDGYSTAYWNIGGYHYIVTLSGPAQNNVKLYEGFTGIRPYPGIHYQVNHKFAAYINVPASSSPNWYEQVCLLDSLGNKRVIIPQAALNAYTLDRLGDNGDLIINAGGRNLVPLNQSMMQICSGLGTSYFRDSSWYIVMWRKIFKLNLNPAPDITSNSSIRIPANSVYTFRASDFTGHFSGAGELLSIQVRHLPSNGSLKLAGNPVVANQTISLLNLPNLSYTPDSGFAQTDTLQWAAYDGFSYTSPNALMALDIIALPEQPILSGLRPVYCINQDSQRVKIMNYPDTSDGISVAVKLDDAPVDVQQSDSSFWIHPSALSPGTHQVTAIFTNIIGFSAPTTASCSVRSLSKPAVQLSGSAAYINDQSGPVTLTASNFSGGGAHPIYLFAKDRGFVNVLRPPSPDSTCIIEPDQLTLRDNWIYVQMTTSDSCSTVPDAFDSVDIKRETLAGITDPDFPNQIIGAVPNPFKGLVTIIGLSSIKQYLISIYSSSGQIIFSRPLEGQATADCNLSNLQRGIFVLKLYDETKGKVLGSLKLVKN